jgi:8-oxo-dGTP pyrophosphatase MutT (NUDIX family)
VLATSSADRRPDLATSKPGGYTARVIKPWRHVRTQTLAETRIFTLNAHTRVSEVTGASADFYVLDSVDWINVVALTEDRQIVLVEQYRQGTRHTTLELPGGMIDPGEEPEEAARRELLEETGFASDSWSLVGTVEPNPATQSNRCYTFLARAARRVAPPAPEGLEEIEVVLEPAARVPELLRAGRITHALVVAGILWWQLAER